MGYPTAPTRHLSGESYYQWAEPVEADNVRYDVEPVFAAGMRHHHTANTAYPIGHNQTFRPYRVRRLRDQEAMKEVLVGSYGSLKEMMLYVHVPFCHTRCQFCEYTVVEPKQGRQEDVQTIYFDALMKEFDMFRDLLDTKKKVLGGFDIGGGTPSFSHVREIERIMNKARDCFYLPENIEVSIETTPRIAASEPDKISAYYKMGIKRISMGLQTMDFEMSKKLGRNDQNFVAKAVEHIRNAGFKSFNIDLMYGFPMRPGREHLWGQTVRDTIALQPEHITLYRMRYKGTRMSHLQDRVELPQIAAQEAEARAILEQHGYHGWMGKNTYSRTPGSSGCSHYLERRVLEGIPYIGLGLGAQSFSRHSLSYNLGAVTKRMFQYVKSTELGRIPIQDLYHLSKPQAIGKFCAVSFYFGGVHRGYFKHCFGLEFDDRFRHEIAFLKHHRLMEDTGQDGERFGMTAAGKKHFSGVVSLFYAPSVQNYLVNLPGGDPWSINEWKTLGNGVIGSAPWVKWPPLPSEAKSDIPPVTKTTVKVPKKSARRGGVADGGRDELIDEDWAIENAKQQAKNASNSSSSIPSLGPGDWAKTNSDGSITMQINGVIIQRPPSSLTPPIPSSPIIPSSASPSNTTSTPSRAYSSSFPTPSSSSPSTPSFSASLPSEKSSNEHYEFGNILFSGPCNQKCPFCIGQQLDSSLSPNNLKKWPLENIDQFVDKMKETKTKKLIMTGTITDPQLYKHEEKLVKHMREQLPGIHISLHTNGLSALPKMEVFNMYDNCTMSINSFNPETFSKLHGVRSMPDLAQIIKESKIPIKLSCIVTDDNRHEIDDYLKQAAKLGIKRVAVRHLYKNIPPWKLFQDLTPIKMHCNNPVYTIHGMEVTYWHFDHTSGRSLNLFADGTISNHYLLSKAPIKPKD